MERRWLLAAAMLVVLVGSAVCKDPFEVLGVDQSASEADIKRAYKRLALRYHPDKNPSPKAKERFLQLQEAYETLSDPSKRRLFEQTKHAAQESYHHASRTANSGGSWGTQFEHDDGFASKTQYLDLPRLYNMVLRSNKPWLIMVYAEHSIACREAWPAWESANSLLSRDGWSTQGRISWLRHRQLVHHIASATSVFGWPLNLDNLPAIYGVRANCYALDCFKRYHGRIDSAGLMQFVADELHDLPRVPALTWRSLDAYLARLPPHRVVALAFAATPGPGSAALRRFCADNKRMVAVARVVYQGQDAERWKERFGILRPPALVVLKGGGEPLSVVQRPPGGRLDVAAVMQEGGHLWQRVPALHAYTAPALGCVLRPQSGANAGHFQTARLCAVVVARTPQAVERARRSMLALLDFINVSRPSPRWRAASKAYQRARLRAMWLLGPAQRAFCTAHVAHVGRGASTALCGWGLGPVEAVVRQWRRWRGEADPAYLLAYVPPQPDAALYGQAGVYQYDLLTGIDLASALSADDITALADWLADRVESGAHVRWRQGNTRSVPPLVDESQQTAAEFLGERWDRVWQEAEAAVRDQVMRHLSPTFRPLILPLLSLAGMMILIQVLWCSLAGRREMDGTDASPRVGAAHEDPLPPGSMEGGVEDREDEVGAEGTDGSGRGTEDNQNSGEGRNSGSDDGDSADDYVHVPQQPQQPTGAYRRVPHGSRREH